MDEKIHKLITKYSVKLLILELTSVGVKQQGLYRKIIEDLKKLIDLETDSMELIISEVRRFQKAPSNFTYTKSQKRNVVHARQLAMYFGCLMTKKTLAEIGDYFGGKDHATVLHSKKTIKNLIDTDRLIRSDVLQIHKNILEKIKEN